MAARRNKIIAIQCILAKRMQRTYFAIRIAEGLINRECGLARLDRSPDLAGLFKYSAERRKGRRFACAVVIVPLHSQRMKTRIHRLFIFALSVIDPAQQAEAGCSGETVI